MWWEYSIAGLLVGFAIGTTGLGGGSLMTPILYLYFGMSPAAAVGTDLLYAAVTKSFGVFFHKRQSTVEWRVVAWLATGSVPAALLTVIVLNVVGIGPATKQVMIYTLGIAIIFTALFALFKARIKRLAKNHINPGFLHALRTRWRKPITILSGVLLGVVVTLGSVGAGTIGTVILLVLYPGLSTIEIVGTDLAHAVILTAIAGLGHLSLGATSFPVLAYLLLGSLPGIYLGTKAGFLLPDRILRFALVIFLLVAGFSLVV